MKQYKDLLQKVVDKGIWKENRTGISTKSIIGAYMQFDLSKGLFPLVTIKQTYWKQAVAEMLCFLRGYDNAAEFRKMGCTVWDANANENKEWLENIHRKGKDDLGRLYGKQGRNWKCEGFIDIDQLKNVYKDLKQGIDNRREIITYWNPGELCLMALPPCHLLHQFSIQGDELHLCMYQRSADLGLGVPFNIVGYSWLLLVMAQITGLKPGKFNHFIADAHIYKDHIEGVMTMLSRDPKEQTAKMIINPKIKTLEDLETWVTIEDFSVVNYNYHGSIKMNMAV